METSSFSDFRSLSGDIHSRPRSQEPATEPDDRAAFGDFLRQARERRQLTLQQIADETKISSRHLDALEQGNVKSLPGGMYRRAMLRAYADSIGLDKATALEHFERTFEPGVRAVVPPAPRAEEPAQEPLPTADRPSRPRDLRVMLVAVILAATAAVGLVTGDGSQPEIAVPAAAVTTAPIAPVTSRAERVAPAPPSRPDAAAVAGAVVSAPPRQTAISPAVIESNTVTATTGRREVEPPVRPQPPRATAGELVIVTEPAGARVTINGTGWGTAPVTVRHLPFGSKRVRVTMDGYASQERIVAVGPDRPSATLRLSLDRAD